jgi:AraC-like DNA-binding protein
MNLTSLIKHFFEITSIPITLYNDGEILASFSPAPEYAGFSRQLIYIDFNHLSDSDFQVSDHFILSGYVRIKKTKKVIVIGPVTEFPLQRPTAYEILKELGESPSQLNKLISYFDSVPFFSYSRFSKYLTFLYFLVNKKEPEEDYIGDFLAKVHKTSNENSIVQIKTPHHSEKAEQYILGLIEYGKTEELINIIRNEKQIEGEMGITATDSIRGYKNILVTTIVLAARSAVRGGLSYEKAMQKSDEYLRQLESLNTYDELHSLWRQVILEYSELSKNSRLLNADSKLVRKVSAYVSDHIFEKITVESIAEYLELNRSYLSRCFKKDTSMKLIDYIHEVKMEESKRLLLYTQKPIVEIAIMLGFSSQNHFQTLFKNMMGTTPAKFRQEGFLSAEGRWPKN